MGALVEAKVDEAERAGELEAMREDVDDMRRRYEAAATRALELETRERRARDSGRFERLVTISNGDERLATSSPRASVRRSPRASGSGSLAFSDGEHPNEHPNVFARLSETTGARVSAGSASARSTREGYAPRSPTRHAKGQRLSSSHARRRSPSPHRRGGSPRTEFKIRRSAGSDETRVASFTEKIDVD